MLRYQSSKSNPLSGKMVIPGDKSISHRALILGATAIGKTSVSGLLESDDVIATADAMRSMGVKIIKDTDNTWHIYGRGVGGLVEPKKVLHLGNSGTGARLIIGLAGSNNFATIITGDASLISRPMDRIITPLEQMGINFNAHAGSRLPLTVSGPPTLIPIKYTLPIPSAQVKSAILLAGLNAPGETTVIEHEPTRDHTELMLRTFGAKVRTVKLKNNSQKITLIGQPELIGQTLSVPSDISSAAFLMVASTIIPKSKLTLQNIGINPARVGLIKSLTEMGASIKIKKEWEECGEKIADIVVESRKLVGVNIHAERAPSMIDEYPILAIAASYANGRTTMDGLAELRVKESDRITLMAEGLRKCGVKIEQSKDTLVVHGSGLPPEGGADIKTNFDHRIAMSFLIFGMNSQSPITIDNGHSIDTSFPGFAKMINNLGGKIEILET